MTRPFARFIAPEPTQDDAALRSLRARVRAACRLPEERAVADLLTEGRLPAALAPPTRELAARLSRLLRQPATANSGQAGLVQNLLQEYALSSREGVALMCLAEALLRIPDRATRNALIRDKIVPGDWRKHIGHSPSLFVNATTWGFLLTGQLLTTHSEAGLSAALGRLITAGGEPLIARGVDLAMRLLGRQFVTGETIEEALAHSEARVRQGFSHSFDMLGEAALTRSDADRYARNYEAAIHAIGRAAAGLGIHDGPGISIKLSALHPRYSRAQRERVTSELYPVLRHLAGLAAHYDIGLNIDAEESERLDISLDLLATLCREPSLAHWQGLGFVIQAYQKRCPAVIDWLVALARGHCRRLMVRLVKGAYWDAEIKRAQVDGLPGYPVFTRKMHTDLSYLACARRLLAAPDAIFPQFATHNAQTLAAVYQLADPARYTPAQYEFQCLHGMGEALYEQVVAPESAGGLARPCRIYAPVGPHSTLLAYLVRRLLENGANTSFINRIADPDIEIESLLREPAEQIDELARQRGAAGLPHPAIPLPAALYGEARRNSTGIDLADEPVLTRLARDLTAQAMADWQAAPLLASETPQQPLTPVRNPANPADVVGHARSCSADEIETALAAAVAAAPAWAATEPARRAALLARAADLLEADPPKWLGLLVREAGKTVANAIAELREAVDFLREYGRQVADTFDNRSHQPLGPVACISPWNFPLAIFMGQVSAALAAGNTVLAKPAEQTPLIAAQAVRLLWEAGVPRGAIQLLPGDGPTVGARLVADPRIRGVLFTGSTTVARQLQRMTCNRFDEDDRPIVLIAETGGQNAMIVDSSALLEQVVTDVVASAFDSAGQRCSALRVLCVQQEVAGPLLDMLRGAVMEMRVGNPDQLGVDIGPVIDDEARQRILAHIDAMQRAGRSVQSPGAMPADLPGSGHADPAPLELGHFVQPTLIGIDSLAQLGEEVFGPVLHVLRYRRDELEQLLTDIRATGYGLTMGLHTRIDETIAAVQRQAAVGNLYVNRNMVGAVVGVQPFGGEGLSGTGPKAGGPLYLLRLLRSHPLDAARRTLQRLLPPTEAARMRETVSDGGLLESLAGWLERQADPSYPSGSSCRALMGSLPPPQPIELRGPVGERNTYQLCPRRAIFCVAAADADRLRQLAAVLAVGSRAIWPADSRPLRDRLPPAVRARVDETEDPAGADCDLVICHGPRSLLERTRRAVASRPGALISVLGYPPGIGEIRLEPLLVERSVSINTAAAGGNASLMTIG